MIIRRCWPVSMWEDFKAWSVNDNGENHSLGWKIMGPLHMTCCCFGFCGTQMAFQSVHFGFLSLILQLASSAKSFSHRLSENMLGLKEKSLIIFRKSRIICGQTCNIHVIWNAHFVPYFGGRILEFLTSALRMWPEVAFLVTGCCNEITKSSVALWLTGVFMWLLMLL